MRWVPAVMLGGGVGLTLFCAAGAATADAGDSTAGRASADRASAAPAQRPGVPEPRGGPEARIVRRESAGDGESAPQLPATSGRSFTVSADAVDAAQGYVDAGGDPADAPRFFSATSP